MLAPVSGMYREWEVIAPAGVRFSRALLGHESHTAEALKALADAVETEAKKLNQGHKCDLICFGCTSGSFIEGSGYDQILIERTVQYHAQYISNLYNWNTMSDLEEVGKTLGVELQWWDAEDWQQWADAVKATMPQHPDDPEWVEAVSLLDAYRQRG